MTHQLEIRNMILEVILFDDHWSYEACYFWKDIVPEPVFTFGIS